MQRKVLKIKSKFLKFLFNYMNFHVRLILFDILLILNKYTFQNSPIFS